MNPTIAFTPSIYFSDPKAWLIFTRDGTTWSPCLNYFILTVPASGVYNNLYKDICMQRIEHAPPTDHTLLQQAIEADS